MVEKTPTKPPADEPQGESKSNKKKRKKMRKKNAPRKSTSNNILTASASENVDRTNGSTTDRSSLDSNCSETELKELKDLQ